MPSHHSSTQRHGTAPRSPRRLGRRGVHRLRNDERGVALTEFALVLPVLMLLLLAMLDMGKAFNYWIDQTHLANMGARWAVVNKNPGAGAGLTLQQFIRSKADTPELRNGGTASVPATPGMQVCISFPEGGSDVVGNPVRVTVSTTYHWLPFIGTNLGGILSTTVTGSAEMRLEQTRTEYSGGCG